MNLIGDQMKPEDWAELRDTGHSWITHFFQELRAILAEKEFYFGLRDKSRV